jgi:hypothetical protein
MRLAPDVVNDSAVSGAGQKVVTVARKTKLFAPEKKNVLL